MVELQTIQTISQIMTAIGVIAAASYYIMNVRFNIHSQKTILETRQVALYMQYTEFAQSVESFKNFYSVVTQEWEDLEDFWRKYGPETNLDAFARFAVTCRFYSRLGMLHELNMIEPEIIYIELGRNAIQIWEKYKEIIIPLRKQFNNPILYLKFEYLYNEMKKIAEQEEAEA